jgi:hypothetical protein
VTFPKSSTIIARMSHALRQGVVAAAFVVVPAAGAAAAPLTQTFTFGLESTPIGTFDTTQGMLLGIEIRANILLSARNPFLQAEWQGNICVGTANGATVDISAAGTPTLLSLDMNSAGSITQGCDTVDFEFIDIESAIVDPSLFSVFTSTGPSTMPLIVTKMIDSVTVTTDGIVRSAGYGWIGGGRVTYTYCPTGEVCAATPVPEPATALMLAAGLAGVIARRRSSRRR